MTLEERAERFYSFPGCLGTACAECSYHGCGPCKDAIHEDAVELLKHETLKREAAEEVARTLKRLDDAATIAEAMKPKVYAAPLYPSDREEIRDLVRVKTEVSDISAHFIQEINELCASLNSLASLVSKLEQLRKGTDPIGYVDDVELEKTELIVCIGTEVDLVFSEAADVINYLWATGLIDNDYHVKVEGIRNEKLARWANRLNGVSEV